jgi:hypothetical protein
MSRILLVILTACLLVVPAEARRRWVPMQSGTGLKASLTAYWKLDETSGNAADATGNGYTMVQTGTAGTDTGIIVNSRTTNGSSSNRMSLADNTAFEPGSSPFFATMWVYTTTLAQTSYPGLFSKETESTQQSWGTFFNDPDNKIGFLVSATGAAPFTIVYTSSAISTSAWQFIAFGWDGSNIMISLNGGAFANVAYATSIQSGTSPVFLGYRAGSSASWNGRIDEVAFWKGRCLTISEVGQIYNSGSGLSYDSW